MAALFPSILHKCYGGTVGVYKRRSSFLKGETAFAVFLPERAIKGSACPQLYVLAGLTCTEETFLTKSTILSYAAEHDLILVAPDTSPRHTGLPGEDEAYDFGSGAGFYLDATASPWSSHYQMGSYISKELPAWIESSFPVKSNCKGIMGHSMGGHGALVHGLRNPDQWKSISAFAPICHPTQCLWGIKAFKGYLGEDTLSWEEYDATCLLLKGHIHPQSILIDQGREDNFLQQGQLRPLDFQAAARKVGQQLNLRFHEGYDHSYWFIQSFMKDHITHHLRFLW
ncbi:S-formylglutathione hydrolase [Entomobacter blattae]|uniref:S-formylglutathione hydrolase n=1 Tax=Entomobacter blattae TaxID=2762277 RepID=A0A7H1NTF3_9PROT|nr:S-formylglutathione hydrolase [Entomobacter blattae]QNT79063.1 S-formylglutathione hydrolase [Entomobacter blattae]